jgi:biotin carboxyl carrier protein
MKMNLRSGGETRAMRVVRHGDSLHVQFEDGESFELHLLSTIDGGFELEHGQARIHGAGTVINGRRQLWVNGHNLVYERARTVAAGTRTAEETSLSSVIPAVVLDVLVEPGQRVAAGDRLVLLESMKMVMPICAPQDGTVSAVRCRKGESVAAGVPLIEIDPVAAGVVAALPGAPVVAAAPAVAAVGLAAASA